MSMRASEFFERFIFTRKCAACSELLDYDNRNEAFCPECRAKWDRAKVEECSICKRAICECVCMTRTLASSGALCHHKLVKYSVKSPVVHGALMFIKKNKNPRVSEFLASELAAVLKADGDIGEFIGSDALVTFVPRSRSAVVRYGHDQSEILADSLAKKLEVLSLPLLKRKRRNVAPQKKLDAKQRAKNAKNTYEVARKYRSALNGKTVLLLDDIVTTGSSMGACVSHLIRAGARVVICASVATTEVKK